jgi:hypothetical protein
MDSVGFGFIACRELVPDVWDLANDVPAALADLVAAADKATKKSQAAKRPAARQSAG